MALEVADGEGQPSPSRRHPGCLSGWRTTSDVSGSMTQWPSGFVAAVLGPGEPPGLSLGPLLGVGVAEPLGTPGEGVAAGVGVKAGVGVGAGVGVVLATADSPLELV